MKRSTRVGVIGGGLGGLAAAACLAAAGLEVVVFEGASELGGKAGVRTVDGVSFDTGPSVFTLLDLVDGVFRDAGTCLEDELDVLPVACARMRFPDVVVDLGFGVEGVVQGVEQALGSEAAGEMRSFLAYSQRVWEAVSPSFVLGPAPTLGSVFARGPRAFGELWRADPLRTMNTAIQSHVRDPRLRAILGRFATYNGSDPRRAPATLNCIAWVELGLGAFGIAGGMGKLADALASVCRRHGVEFRTSSPVRRIESTSSGVSAVLLDAERVEVSAVVCNAEASQLASTLAPGVVRPAGEWSTSGWTAVLRTKRTSRPAHEVLFAMPYDDEFADLFDAERAPVEPTVYVCAQEVAHQRTGWDSEEALFIMTNAPAGCESVAESRARALQRVAEAGVASVDDVLWERTPLQLAERFPGSRGSLYGASSNSRFAAFQRPSNRSRLPGLYLASGSAHPGGGVPMVMQSGRMAARLLLEDQP